MCDEICEQIRKDYSQAKKKEDFDLILKKYNIKMLKNGKLVSALRVKLDIKKAIIRMKMYEYDDSFDYDCFISK